MSAIRIETDILEQLPEETLAVLRERALRDGKSLIEVAREVLIEMAERFDAPPKKAA